MSIRDRMIDAAIERADAVLDRRDAEIIVDAQLAACPEIAALDHAREGWLDTSPAHELIDYTLIYQRPEQNCKRVLVIEAPESS